MVLVFLTKTLALLQLPKREGGDNDMEKNKDKETLERDRQTQRRRHKLSPTVYYYQQDLPGKR